MGRKILSALSFTTTYRGPYHDSYDVYADTRLTGAEKDAEMFRRDAVAIRGDWARVGQDMHKALNRYENGER